MSIVDWVYAYPGTLEALLERHWTPDDIFRMTTAEAVARAADPLPGAWPSTFTVSQVTYAAAMCLKVALDQRALEESIRLDQAPGTIRRIVKPPRET